MLSLKKLALRFALAAVTTLSLLACGSDGESRANGSRYVLGSVVIDPENNRTTYVQTIDSLEGTFTNDTALELPGNGVLMAGGKDFFVGLAEEPTWVRYSVDDSGKIAETGRMSLASLLPRAQDVAHRAGGSTGRAGSERHPILDHRLRR